MSRPQGLPASAPIGLDLPGGLADHWFNHNANQTIPGHDARLDAVARDPSRHPSGRGLRIGFRRRLAEPDGPHRGSFCRWRRIRCCCAHGGQRPRQGPRPKRDHRKQGRCPGGARFDGREELGTGRLYAGADVVLGCLRQPVPAKEHAVQRAHRFRRGGHDRQRAADDAGVASAGRTHDRPVPGLREGERRQGQLLHARRRGGRPICTANPSTEG